MLDSNIIHNEMMIHIPMNTHKEAKSVLVIDMENDIAKEELAKYDAKVTFSKELNIDEKFDVIIYNSDKLDELTLASIQRALEPKEGILVCTSQRFKKDANTLADDLKNVGKDFWICMPYRFGHTMAILASKKYHPQADIILDRSDFIEAQYYNTELQNACFIHPTYIKKALTGIAKR
jgi:spermidine synthase